MKQQRLNVDSPTFTPLQPATNGAVSNARVVAISPKAANAKIFTPKSQKSGASFNSCLNYRLHAQVTLVSLALEIDSLSSTYTCVPAISPPNAHNKKAAQDWNPQSFQEFVPQNYESEQYVGTLASPQSSTLVFKISSPVTCGKFNSTVEC